MHPLHALDPWIESMYVRSCGKSQEHYPGPVGHVRVQFSNQQYNLTHASDPADIKACGMLLKLGVVTDRRSETVLILVIVEPDFNFEIYCEVCYRCLWGRLRVQHLLLTYQRM